MDARTALFTRSNKNGSPAPSGLPGRSVRREPDQQQQGGNFPPPPRPAQPQDQYRQSPQAQWQQPPPNQRQGNPQGGNYQQPQQQQQPGNTRYRDDPQYDDFQPQSSGNSSGQYAQRPPQDFANEKRAAPPMPYQAVATPPKRALVDKIGDPRWLHANKSAVPTHLFPDAERGPAAHQVNPGEYYLMVVDKGRVLTAKPKESFDADPPSFTVNKFQRPWLDFPEFAPKGEKCEVQPYDGPRPALGRMTLTVDFASPAARKGGTPESSVMYMQNELSEALIRKTIGDFYAPKQAGLMVYGMDDKNDPKLKFEVDSVQFLDPYTGNLDKAIDSAEERGILTETTELVFNKAHGSPINVQLDNRAPAKNAIIRPDFKFADMGIGGLDEEFSTIFRRAFASRVFPPGLVQQMGISHVKGLLLYGPPGTGKTLIARQIGKMLNAKPPKIINGPEILNKYVGQSEENVRKVFKDAEDEYKEKGDASDLHIIIFDELDAVCKQRGSTGGGTGVGDSIVNQLLTKLDGVDSLNNILLIGMTNRKDMIDEALLRPGRLEVHMEISLPDEHGRIQILNIHTAKVRAMKKLAADVDIDELGRTTKNFSGAELNGLVKAALSYAFTRHTKIGDVTGVEGRPEDVMLTRDDFMRALEDVKPAYGVSEEELESSAPNGIVHYSPHIRTILANGMNFVEQLRAPQNAPLLSVLIHGARGAGKTALAAEIGLKSKFPFVKLVRPIDVGTNEGAKLEYLRRVFADAYKSTLSMVILDRIETIIDWNPIGQRFSNAIVQYISSLLQTTPPKGRRLLIVATTSRRSMLDLHETLEFDREITVPTIQNLRELQQLLSATERIEDNDVQDTLNELRETRGDEDVGVGVKAIFSALETAMVRKDMPLGSCLASELSEIIDQRNPRRVYNQGRQNQMEVDRDGF
ncbi:P-loop containing nucleoside triphosphate hydrolase protein [Microdochium bolleyi]|uniref:Vesicular-fusion protein SEC18 n=1 Tax=Microdochium bolleyi TaxID=196109 RepID=A0A136JH93_9PEZI|nr:P-loop containing nucleoside triphosphate hydrolase protein [Microdochium bolleyi]